MSPVAFVLRVLIRFYQLTFSALIGRTCRFAPSCSEYAQEAIATHGAARGSWLALKRVCRCHPWGGSGYDPVPPRRSRDDAALHRH
jgi:putative membrane protein insertion efficiency factor